MEQSRYGGWDFFRFELIGEDIEETSRRQIGDLLVTQTGPLRPTRSSESLTGRWMNSVRDDGARQTK